MMRSDAATCDLCGQDLRPADLHRGLAHAVDPRNLCAGCRTLHTPPPLPTRPVATTGFQPWSSSRPVV